MRPSPNFPDLLPAQIPLLTMEFAPLFLTRLLTSTV